MGVKIAAVKISNRFKNHNLDSLPLQNRRILVVEDSEELRILIRDNLKEAGAVVETANDGLEGLNQALSDEYDAVIMDIEMPILDGNTAVKWLRQMDYKRPIIALTSTTDPDKIIKSIQNGFNLHITKPFRSEVLTSAVIDVCS